MSDETDKIIQRIRKCLALSRSSEPHEAAAALRQAQKLMEKFGISEDSVRMAEVKEAASSAGRSVETPPAWLSALATVVSEAFGVSEFFKPNFMKPHFYAVAEFVFVGVGPAAEVASYTFTVLRRKCSAARADYYRRLRGHRANRIRRADDFAAGWVIAVRSKVRAFARETPKVVAQYLQERHSGLVNYKPIDRGDERNGNHRVAGWIAGQNVDLHHGVNGTAPRQLTNTESHT